MMAALRTLHEMRQLRRVTEVRDHNERTLMIS